MVNRLRLPLTCLAASIMLCVAVWSLRPHDPAAAESVEATNASGMAAPGAADLLPAPMPMPVREDQGRLEIVRLPTAAALPKTTIEPLFEPDARVKIGETAKLRFAVRDRASGAPDSLDHVSASVRHGNDPELTLPVEEVDHGVYEVPFTPHGPGQFTIVLSQDGNPLGSRKVGAAGVAGAPSGVDAVDPLSVDPRGYRARTGARARRR
jgi:hypothetical protein